MQLGLISTVEARRHSAVLPPIEYSVIKTRGPSACAMRFDIIVPLAASNIFMVNISSFLSRNYQGLHVGRN